MRFDEPNNYLKHTDTFMVAVTGPPSKRNLSAEHVHLFVHCFHIMVQAVRGPFVEPAVERQSILFPVEVDTSHSVPVSAADRTSTVVFSQLLLLFPLQCHKAKEALNVLCSQEAGMDSCRPLEEGLFSRPVLRPVVLLLVAKRREAALHTQHQEHCQRHSRHQQPAYQLKRMNSCEVNTLCRF